MTKRIAIVTVHGTRDSDTTDAGPKWWQRSSLFAENLRAALLQVQIDATIHPFIWSGDNNALQRERAAVELSAFIRKVSKKSGGGVHIIGHSHGGNVANDAAIALNWGKGRSEAIATLTTVGTPFLKSPVTTFQIFGAYVFAVVAVFGALVLGAIGIASIANDVLHGLRSETWIIGASVVVGGVIFWLMIVEALQGIQRVLRTEDRKNAGASVYSIWHPEDEAIAMLRGAETLALEPFDKGALISGSRTGGILWAVRIVVVFIVTAAAFLIAMALGLGPTIGTFFSGLGLQSVGDWLTSPTGLGLARENPITFLEVLGAVLAFGGMLWSSVYIAFRLVFGFAAELLFRRAINSAIQDVFRGMAFGSVGDQRPTEVQTGSFNFDTREEKLSGALAEKIMDGAQHGAMQLLSRYRREIFSTSADYSDLFARIPKDSMTWTGLVHTTYFAYSEVVDLIVRHISSSTFDRPLSAKRRATTAKRVRPWKLAMANGRKAR